MKYVTKLRDKDVANPKIWKSAVSLLFNDCH